MPDHPQGSMETEIEVLISVVRSEVSPRGEGDVVARRFVVSLTAGGGWWERAPPSPIRGW